MTQPSEDLTAPADSAMSRLRQRLFPARTASAEVKAPRSNLPVVARPRHVALQASIAEFLLINRLRARFRAQPCADMLERAARIVFVTCQNWFALAEPRERGPRTHI